MKSDVSRKFSSGNKPLARRILTALGITALAFMLSFFLTSPFSASVSALFSSPEKADFVMSDLFAQVADSRPVRHLDHRITIVDIGIADRYAIAEGLQALAGMKPKAVGLDVNFAYPTEDDSFLLQSLQEVPHLILPVTVDMADSSGYRLAEVPFFYGELNGPEYAVANLAGTSRYSTIRHMSPSFSLDNGSSIPSFAAALAGKAGIVTHAEDDGKKLIKYHSREFSTIPLAEIADRPDLINGKIVIVGALSDASDMHATPVNHYMAGMLIHAYSLATMLDGSDFHEIPEQADYILAFLVCFVLVWTTLTITNRIKGLLLRITQVVFLYLAVRIGYSLYVDHSTVINFQYTFLMIAFGLFAVDIWNGMSEIILFCKSRLSSLLKLSTSNV